MSLILFKTFLTIVETGSLVKASKMLNVTQSTVTSRLQTLERDIGQTLLNRHKSGVSLTVSGMKFKRYAEAMQNMWQQALLETSLPKGMDAVCNLGCEPDLWTPLARSLMTDIREKHPKTALNVKTGNRRQIEEWLAAGLIDCALTYRASNLANMVSTIIDWENLAVYSTIKDGPLKNDPNYTYFDAGPDFGREHAAAYTDAGVAKCSFDVANCCLDFILDNGGSSYLPEKLAAPYVEQGKIYRLEKGPVFTSNVYLICNKTALSNWIWLPDLAKQTAEITNI